MYNKCIILILPKNYDFAFHIYISLFFVNIIIYKNEELIINIQFLYILIYQQKNM